MSFDPSKLSLAPWYHSQDNLWETIQSPTGDVLSYDTSDDGIHGLNPEDMPFIALARNAFDVMMRRGWGQKLRTTALGLCRSLSLTRLP